MKGRTRQALAFDEVQREDGGDGTDTDEEGLEYEQNKNHDAPIDDSQVFRDGEEIVITEAKSKKRITLSLANRGSVVCTVCGQRGHTAGFRGSVYVDCPVKPCYLCKQSGHTTATCPYRLDPTLHVAARHANSNNMLSAILSRETTSQNLSGRFVGAPYRKVDWSIRSACLKLHPRRITCLGFPAASLNLVISACKKGHLAIWDFEEVYERTTYDDIHAYQINGMCFAPGGDGMRVLTASADGHARSVDVETGAHFSLANLNPDGWVEGVSTQKSWKMFQSVAAHGAAPARAFAGDSAGKGYCLDTRMTDVAWTGALHATSSKVMTLDFHPLDANLLLSAGGDHVCRLFDVRMLRSRAPGGAERGMCASVAELPHSKVVSAAYFSPRTGRAVLTTCADNRLRVWDHVARLDQPPSRELVHSHDFNRYLSPFRAVWDPKDPLERTAVIGRYISEDYDGQALHPVDILDVSTGALLDSLVDPNLELINPVNAPHPLIDAVVTGASGHLYCWRPVEEEEAEEEDGEVGAAETDGGSNDEGASARGTGSQGLGTSSGGLGTGGAGASPAGRWRFRRRNFSAYDAGADTKKAKGKAAAKRKGDDDTPGRGRKKR